MNTRKLFTENVYLKECQAAVVEANPQEGYITLDSTVFFPTGGGQSCDLGYINDIEVTDVFEKDGVVYHRMDSSGENFPTAGQQVSCILNWERRFDNMQRHCGEHILSGMFFRLYQGINHGFHMGDDYMTIDILLPEGSAYSSITWDMAMAAEKSANEAICSNAPVITRVYSRREETLELPLRKAVAIDDDITIVCVGNLHNPSDCVACCGTHPTEAGQVGLLKILKVESYKGMTRIYFEAGRRALSDYGKKHDLVATLGTKYSAGPLDLLEKITLQEEKNKAMRGELHLLKQSVIKSRISEVEGQLQASYPASNSSQWPNIITREYDDMKADDLIAIGRGVADKVKRLFLITSVSENILLLFSDGSIDCGKLVRENASIYNGKGGGQKNNARAIFSNREYLDTFIDLIDKHLR